MHLFKKNLGTTTCVGILIQKASCNFRIKVKVKMTVILMFLRGFPKRNQHVILRVYHHSSKSYCRGKFWTTDGNLKTL